MKSLASRLLCMLALALLPVWSATASPYPENTENWAVNSAWIKELPRDEQTIVLVTLALELSTHADQTLLPAVKDPAGMRWVLKVSGNGNHMLMDIATRSDTLRAIFRDKADAYLNVINGRMSADAFSQTMDAINTRIDVATTNITAQDIARVRAAYRTRIAETETTLIAYAKLRST